MLVKQSVNYVQRYTLTDLFDRTFRMLGTSWKVSLLGGLVIVGPAAILLAIVVPLQIRNVVAVSLEASQGSAADTDILLTVLLWTGLSLIASFVYAAAALWARLSVIHTVRDGVMATAPRWSASVGQAFRGSLLRAIGQGVLKTLIGIAVFGIPTVLFVLVSAGGGWVPPLLVGMIYLGATGVFIWIFVSFAFSAEAIVFDGTGVTGGLKKSWALVRGNWWRLFGISLLITIMISFVSGLVTTPIIGASFIPMSSEWVDLILSEGAGDDALLQAFSNTGALSIAIGLATIIQQLISLLLVPVFYSLFYVDLKVRHGELESRAPSADETGPAVEPTTVGDAAPAEEPSSGE
jgi:hypothetical protein